MLKYNNIDSLVINETELRHEMRNKDDTKFLSLQLQKKINTNDLLVTRGKHGAILLSKKINLLLKALHLQKM